MKQKQDEIITREEKNEPHPPHIIMRTLRPTLRTDPPPTLRTDPPHTRRKSPRATPKKRTAPLGSLVLPPILQPTLELCIVSMLENQLHLLTQVQF